MDGGVGQGSDVQVPGVVLEEFLRPSESLGTSYTWASAPDDGSGIPSNSVLGWHEQATNSIQEEANPRSDEDIQNHERPIHVPARASAHFQKYQQYLDECYYHLYHGRIRQGLLILRKLTQWVVENIRQLAYHLEVDERDRILFWSELNNAWLAILRTNLAALKQPLRLVDALSAPVRPLTRRALAQAGNEIVAWSDTLNTAGLVDFQVGLWEEEIITGGSCKLDWTL